MTICNTNKENNYSGIKKKKTISNTSCAWTVAGWWRYRTISMSTMRRTFLFWSSVVSLKTWAVLLLLLIHTRSLVSTFFFKALLSYWTSTEPKVWSSRILRWGSWRDQTSSSQVRCQINYLHNHLLSCTDHSALCHVDCYSKFFLNKKKLKPFAW